MLLKAKKDAASILCAMQNFHLKFIYATKMLRNKIIYFNLATTKLHINQKTNNYEMSQKRITELFVMLNGELHKTIKNQ